jgi:hypothetical protein
MESPIRTYSIAGGFVAYVWIDGLQIVGVGKTLEAAQADLNANIRLHTELREKAGRADRAPSTA